MGPVISQNAKDLPLASMTFPPGIIYTPPLEVSSMRGLPAIEIITHTRRCVAAIRKRARYAIFYVVAKDSQGPAGARNAAWRRAAGNIIAFTDDDTQPDPDWLSKGLSAFRDLKIVAAWGKVIMPLGPNPTDWEWDAAKLQKAVFVTANCFCRRSLLEKIGGFDQRFTLAWREDTDLYFSILEYLAKHEPSGKVIACPEAKVLHPIRQAHWGVSIPQQRKAFFEALLYKKHPSLYRRDIKIHACWRYYAMSAALVTAWGCSLTGNTTWALMAWALWGLLTCLLIGLRLQHTSKKPWHVLGMVVTSLIIPYLSLY